MSSSSKVGGAKAPPQPPRVRRPWLQVIKNINLHPLHERTVCSVGDWRQQCWHTPFVNCSVDEKIGFPNHSSRYEFYNRSALI